MKIDHGYLWSSQVREMLEWRLVRSYMFINNDISETYCKTDWILMLSINTESSKSVVILSLFLLNNR